MSSPSESEDDIVAKVWAKLYSSPEHAERERLKTRVLELEVENRQLVIDVEYWRRRATRNAP